MFYTMRFFGMNKIYMKTRMRERERERERQTDRQTDRQMGKWTSRQHHLDFDKYPLDVVFNVLNC